MGDLEFLFNSKIIDYDNLSKWIKDEYLDYINKMTNLKKEEIELENKLDIIKKDTIKKEKEYIFKQKQIATYLECKNTFLGKVKYFFKSKKIKQEYENKEEINKEEHEVLQNIDKIDDKEFYTIEDLISICRQIDEIYNKVKNMKLDIKALENKLKNLETKIQNASCYIKEIDSHTKSIFEFWKFANKDEALALNAGQEIKQEEKQNRLRKVFDYKDDIEELGIKIDNIQRQLLSKNECDSIYIASTDILKDINALKNNKQVDFNTSLKKLKKEAEEQRLLFSSEEFDIFGAVSEDNQNIKTLANKKHREIKKNKIQILEITKNTTVEEYEEKLRKIIQQINESIEKVELFHNEDVSVYIISENNLYNKDFEIGNINPENAIKKAEKFDKISLYRLNLKENTKAVAFSNIMFYDNNNKTLPIGMDASDEILIDMQKVNLELKRQKLFRINQQIDEMNIKTKIICVYEYDVL